MAGRSEILRRRREDAAATKIVNRKRKDRERRSRDTRMAAKIKANGPPYAPAVLSWLSRRLGKPAGKISPADIERFLRTRAS